jgi:Domain of unknown function (DUF4136)
MHIRGWIVWLALGLLAAGCASSGPTVLTDFNPSTEFAAFRTFAFLGISDRGLEVGPSDTSPVRNRVKEMIREQLAAKGVREVALDDHPDLLVHLLYGVKDLRRVQKNLPVGGLLGPLAKIYAYEEGSWVPVLANKSMTSEDHQGTLVVDLAESSKQKLVWRAVIRAVLKDNMQQNFGLARKGIAEAFKDYPPRK